MLDTHGAGGGVQLEVLRTAEIPTPHDYLFRARGHRLAQLRAGISKKGRMLQSPCLAYVIRHPELGVLLVDTGLHPDASSGPPRRPRERDATASQRNLHLHAPGVASGARPLCGRQRLRPPSPATPGPDAAT